MTPLGNKRDDRGDERDVDLVDQVLCEMLAGSRPEYQRHL